MWPNAYVQHLSYFFPYDWLLVEFVQNSVRDDNDEVMLRNKAGQSDFIRNRFCSTWLGSTKGGELCGIPVDALMELLTFYLCSFYVGCEQQLFVQKPGVCIGTSVALVLSEIFRSNLDGIPNRKLANLHKIAAHWYVDITSSLLRGMAFTKKCKIMNNGCSLAFMFEVPENGYSCYT